jgi:hypothetical protein
VAEFASTISASFGEDLTWFTDQWVMNPGSPDYEWNYSSEQVGGQELLKLAIWQTQDLGGYGLFTMPIDIRVTTASTVTVYTVWNDDWSEYYVLPVDGPVLAVEFDDDAGGSNRNWILWSSSSQVATALDPPPVLLDVEIFHDSPSSGQTTLVLTFSEDIGSFDPLDVALAGSGSGAHVPISWSYDAGSRQATLTYAALPADDYTLTILSAARDHRGAMPEDESPDWRVRYHLTREEDKTWRSTTGFRFFGTARRTTRSSTRTSRYSSILSTPASRATSRISTSRGTTSIGSITSSSRTGIWTTPGMFRISSPSTIPRSTRPARACVTCSGRRSGRVPNST